MTGLAQVSGRNALSWEAKFAKDVEYIERRSLRLDVTIVARTVVRVIRRDGISDGAGPTTSEFLGSVETRDAGQSSGLDSISSSGRAQPKV